MGDWLRKVPRKQYMAITKLDIYDEDVQLKWIEKIKPWDGMSQAFSSTVDKFVLQGHSYAWMSSWRCIVTLGVTSSCELVVIAGSWRRLSSDTSEFLYRCPQVVSNLRVNSMTFQALQQWHVGIYRPYGVAFVIISSLSFLSHGIYRYHRSLHVPHRAPSKSSQAPDGAADWTDRWSAAALR